MITRITTIEITEVQVKKEYLFDDWEKAIKMSFPYDGDDFHVVKVQDFIDDQIPIRELMREINRAYNAKELDAMAYYLERLMKAIEKDGGECSHS